MKRLLNSATILFWYAVGSISVIALFIGVLFTSLSPIVVAMYSIVLFISLATIDILKALRKSE